MSLEFEVECRLGGFGYAASLAAENELVVLFGHSGAGKSLTLQFIAGLLRPDRGRIVVAGATVFDSAAGVSLPPQQRRAGYVVQDLALFEHMSVEENVAFGLPAGRDRRTRVHQLLQLLDLEGFENRRPRTLSGGQRQRVALARALAREAPLLLLDEPFSALDDSLRHAMRRELLRLRSELGLTILFVTHDLREAHFLGDRLAVFDGGRVLQFDERETVFRRPLTRRVAELTGVANLLEARVVAVEETGPLVDAGGAILRCGTSGCSLQPGQAVDVAIRAERVILRRVEPAGQARNQMEAVIAQESAYGSSHTLSLTPVGAGVPLEVELGARPYEVLGVAGRKRWTVELPPEDLHVMAR
jgi:ABC-type sulfate/molybdate transport systems ATPase subunit